MYMMSNIIIHTLSRALIRWTFVKINHYIFYILHVEIVEVYWHTVSSSSHQMLEELQKTYRPIDSQYQHIYQLCFFSMKSNYSNTDMIFMKYVCKIQTHIHTSHIHIHVYTCTHIHVHTCTQ